MVSSKVPPTRPPKQSSREILRDLGYDSVKSYLFDEFDGGGGGEGAGGEEDAPDNFWARAFPEFNGNGPGMVYTEVGWKAYFAAYDFTYARHYEMEDDYIATRTDPDYFQFTGEKLPLILAAASTHDALLHQVLRLEAVEFAMLSIADNEYWHRGWAGRDDGGYLLSWTSHWRREFGKVDTWVDGETKGGFTIYEFKALNRHNWRDVREAVVTYAKKRKESGTDYYNERWRIDFLTMLDNRFHAGRDEVNRLAGTVWKEYIEEKSGFKGIDESI